MIDLICNINLTLSDAFSCDKKKSEGYLCLSLKGDAVNRNKGEKDENDGDHVTPDDNQLLKTWIPKQRGSSFRRANCTMALEPRRNNEYTRSYNEKERLPFKQLTKFGIHAFSHQPHTISHIQFHHARGYIITY